jgi:hypothetical protein
VTSYLDSPPRWWQWLTILSLDAPLVCLCWQALLARVLDVRLRWPEVAVLAISVWLAYAADRWIEGWRLDARIVRTQRHLFYQRRRWPVAGVWVTAFAADVGLALAGLARRELTAGLLLLLPVLAYLLSHQTIHRHRRWRAPKEVVVAVLLTGGVALFLEPAVSVARLVEGLTIFAVLSFANCALISSWEHDVDLAHGQNSLVVDFARARRFVVWLPWLLAAWGVLMEGATGGPMRVVVACGVASAALLGAVDRVEPRIGRAAARVLADVALMTPVLPLAWVWFR